MIRAINVLAIAAALGGAQTRTMTEGSHRMELMLERLDGDVWHPIDPGLVLNQGDRVRFKFRTNFDGFLYVMNQSTSGKYEQLFPRQDTGQENKVAASREYLVPATSTAFRIAGPPGHEIVYWLVTPARLTERSAHHSTRCIPEGRARTHSPLRRHHPQSARRLRRFLGRSQAHPARRTDPGPSLRPDWPESQ